ncbi:hypothetical protein [Leuconostoc citreum]|uniref:hypothetical protein n=1 Tax=Leuconostoc citreum TaxID=33964 RepID=UPI001910A3B0|nr:hypothetical protein [Leuconostoc citreum]QQE97553.1 hypothetical protein LeuC0096_05110 [Leuconostoc citreum]
MTFDDVIKEIYNPLIYQWPSPSGEMVSVAKQKTTLELVETIKELKQEYAPTIEMTLGQAKTITDPEQGDSLLYLLSDYGPGFDYLFWELLTEKQVAQVWLHPETIKVIGENNAKRL